MLLNDSRGLTSVEFALVATLFFAIVLGITDFARAMWEWNAAAKATQAGARFAAVTDLIALDMKNYRGLANGLRTGSEIPVGASGTSPVVCNSSGCAGDLANMDATAFAALVTRMRRVDDRIAPVNVVVEYRHVGHGFVGNPLGPDLTPAVTVRLRAMTFQFVTPGLAGIISIAMPDFAATLTSEDGAST
ncbi:MAG: TadE family protein [Alphaproteobacteria bacterium]